MTVTRDMLEKRIHELLFERQGYLDKANGCAGAISLLQAQLADTIRDDEQATKTTKKK